MSGGYNNVGIVCTGKYSITTNGSQINVGTHGFGAHSRLSNIKILEKAETVQQHNNA